MVKASFPHSTLQGCRVRVLKDGYLIAKEVVGITSSVDAKSCILFQASAMPYNRCKYTTILTTRVST